MPQPLEEQGSPQRWIFFFLIFGLIGISALFVLSRVFQYSGPQLLNSPYSVESRLHAISVGDARFYVPENIIRHPDQRNGSLVKSLNLVLLWPTLEGFSLDNQVAFHDVSDKSRLVFVTLSEKQEAISSSERLYSVYSQYFTGEPIKGPGSLIGFAMEKDSGFAGEIVYFKPDEETPFVTRCVTPVEKTPTFCMRDITLGNGIQLSYRFRLHLLENWESLDQAIGAKVSAFIQK